MSSKRKREQGEAGEDGDGDPGPVLDEGVPDAKRPKEEADGGDGSASGSIVLPLATSGEPPAEPADATDATTTDAVTATAATTTDAGAADATSVAADGVPEVTLDIWGRPRYPAEAQGPLPCAPGDNFYLFGFGDISNADVIQLVERRWLPTNMTCGLVDSESPPDHSTCDLEKCARLQEACDKLEAALEGFTVSSEGEQPWLGFFVTAESLEAMGVDEDDEEEATFRKLFHLPDGVPFACKDMDKKRKTFFPSSMYYDYNHVSKSKLAKVKRATNLLRKTATPASCFTVTVTDTRDQGTFPQFVGGWTREGDIVGVYSFAAWT